MLSRGKSGANNIRNEPEMSCHTTSKKALKDYQHQGLCPKNDGANLKWFVMAKDETGWV